MIARLVRVGSAAGKSSVRSSMLAKAGVLKIDGTANQANLANL
jgi:hypothetical protein